MILPLSASIIRHDSTTKLDEAFLIHGHNSYPEIRVRVKTKRGEPFLYLVVGHLREIFHGVYPQTLHFVQSNVRRIQDDTSPLNVILSDVKGLDGRVLLEALNGGPDEEQIPVETRIFTTETATRYRATIQVTNLGSPRYIDKSWRVR